MKIRKADNIVDYQKIESLAYEIIPEFYADIVPHEHNMFFVRKFQTVDAIQQQIKNGYEYYILYNEEETVGYLGIQIGFSEPKMVLSKLYIRKDFRGLGFGTKAMEFIVNRANEIKVERIMLIVNRKNENAINLYKKHKFTISKELVNEFENGFAVLDYEMTRIVASA